MDWSRKRISTRVLALLLVTLLALSTVACQRVFRHQGRNAIAEDDMQYLIDMYEHEQMMAWIKDLTSATYGGREAGTAHEDLAGDYIIDLLQSFGLEPWRDAGFDDYRHAFEFPGGKEPAENIIAVLPGESSDKYVIIGAHYDHIGTIDNVLYPGADDNAVGTGAVLELARIFSQSELTPDYSIVFVLFGAEEKGLIGAAALAGHLRQRELADKIVLLNLDVIAGVSGDTLVVYDNGFKDNKTWAERAQAEAKASGINAKISSRLAGGVDSMRFTEQRIPAVTLVWGDLLEEHPHLHQPGDTFENLNPKIVAAATKASIRIAWAFANE